MKLKDVLGKIECRGALLRDGEFEALEQCTRVRVPLSLTYLENSKYLDRMKEQNISCVISKSELQKDLLPYDVGVLITETPKLAFFRLHNYLAAKDKKVPTKIDPSAKISPQSYIAPYNVCIGKNVEIQPMAVIHENTVIQDDVRICSGTVVAGQSFTAVHTEEGTGFLVQDRGGVLLEEGVEICSNCHIARGTLQNDMTILGAYTKVDAMVHIGHGTVIGKNTLIPAGATISGNCVIGDYVWIGVNATVSNRIQIGDRARISLGAVVTKDVPEEATVSGNFAINHQRFIQNLKASITD